MTDDELKKYDLIVEHLNRAKISASRGDEVGERFHLLAAQELLSQKTATKTEPAPA